MAGSALAVAMAAAAGCGDTETAGPVTAAQPGEAAESPARTLVESTGSLFDETNELGRFPAFLPPVGFGVDSQECQLGSDPYSTCI